MEMCFHVFFIGGMFLSHFLTLALQSFWYVLISALFVVLPLSMGQMFHKGSLWWCCQFQQRIGSLNHKMFVRATCLPRICCFVNTLISFITFCCAFMYAFPFSFFLFSSVNGKQKILIVCSWRSLSNKGILFIVNMWHFLFATKEKTGFHFPKHSPTFTLTVIRAIASVIVWW